MTSSLTNEFDETYDDADPMIDALLAEFVPTDPARRKAPPDLTQQILAKLADDTFSEKSSSRGELLGKVDEAVHASTAGSAAAAPPEEQSLRWRKFVAVLAVATCLAIGVWIAGKDSDSQNNESIPGGVAVNGEPNGALSGIENPEIEIAPIENIVESDATEKRDGPIRGIPLDDPRAVVATDDSPTTIDDATGSEEPVRSIASIVAVASQLDQSARDYWKNLGIEPTADAAPETIANRLEDRLGVRLTAEFLNDPNRLREQLSTNAASREIAKRWLASVSPTTVGRLTTPDYRELLTELGDGISAKSSFATQWVSLLDGTNDHSSQLYQALGAVGDTETVAVNLASLSMNADLRCIRCHDSKIGGHAAQDSYWSFVAMVRGALSRGQDNRWSVDAEKKAAPVFFDLPDGRARMADARVDFLSDVEAPKDFRTFAQALPTNRAFADGVVDSLWKLVHGRKLKASLADAEAAPMDSALSRIHDTLSSDLLASNFDVARTLALIIASPMAQRSVPDALQDQHLLTASDDRRSAALEQVGAFAGAIDLPASNRRQRVNMVMRRIGGSVDSSGDALLAQPLISDAKTARDRRASNGIKLTLDQMLSVDFPGDDSGYPVSWLRSIDDYNQQVQHLAYLAGSRRVPSDVAQLAAQLKDSGSVEVALSRLWWVLND